MKNDILMHTDAERGPGHQDGSLFAARVWRGIVGVCLIAVMFLLWDNRLDAAFVVATLGAVAWFMPLRNRLHRARIEASAAELRANKELDFEGRNED